MLRAIARLVDRSVCCCRRRARRLAGAQVTIVTPFAAGGIADVVARLTAERLQARSSRTSSSRTSRRRRRHGRARARRQGRARRLHADVDADLPAHHGEVRAERDLRRERPSSRSRRSASAPFAITVNASFPGKTLADFIAHVKANPGKLSFGSAGAGSTTHVAAVMVLKAAGLDMIHVPYRGVAPAFTDLLAGHIVDGRRLAGRAQAVSGIRQAQGARGRSTPSRRRSCRACRP